MSKVARRTVVGALILWSTALASTAVFADSSEPASTALIVPRPDLGALQKTPREKIESLQETLAGALAEGKAESREMLEGFGFLGLLFHSAQLLDAAEICYRNAQSLAPEDGRWPYYLGLARNAKGDLEGAVEGYRDSLRLEPGRVATRLRLAESLLDLGRLEESRIHFEAASRTGPDTVAALFGLGRIAALMGDHQRAIELFETVLAEQPEASVVHYSLAQALRELGRTEEAERHLERRGDRRVGFPDPLADVLLLTGKNAALEVIADLAAAADFSEEAFLGFVLSQFGEIVGAAQRVERMLAALERSGSTTAAQAGRIHYAAGALFAAQGEDEAAIAHLEAAIEGDETLRDARVKLGNALARGGRFEEALTLFDDALRMRSDDTDVLAKRASILVGEGRLEEAGADLERAVELSPSDPRGWRLLAGVEERLGDADGAVAHLERALELSATAEDRMAAHKQLGDLHYREARLDEAARRYLEALRIDEGYVPALKRLAAVLGELRQYDAAAHTYARWSVREPASVEARVGEATALILGGRLAEARDRLESGLVALPGQLDLKDILARHLAASPDPAIRDGARALELAQELYDRVPTPQSIETLAMAHAQVGAFGEAIRWQTKLLEDGDGEVAAEQLELWRRNLDRYQSRTACCAAPNP